MTPLVLWMLFRNSSMVQLQFTALFDRCKWIILEEIWKIKFRGYILSQTSGQWPNLFAGATAIAGVFRNTYFWTFRCRLSRLSMSHPVFLSMFALLGLVVATNWGIMTNLRLSRPPERVTSTSVRLGADAAGVATGLRSSRFVGKLMEARRETAGQSFGVRTLWNSQKGTGRILFS